MYRAEQVQGQVEPVHAGVGQEAAAGQVGGVTPATPQRPHAQAQPDEHGPADRAGIDEPLGLGVRGVEDLVVGHAEGHARGGRGVDQLLAFRHADRQRFLHQHVLAGPDRFQGHGEVQVVRQADADRADLGVGDQLAGVPVAADALGLEGRQQVRSGIGDGHQARGARLPDRGRVDLADLAEADQPDGARSRGVVGTHGSPG